CDLCRWDRRDHEHRAVDALALRRLEGRGRCADTGIWPVLRDAKLLSTRRLTDRAESLGRGAPWISELSGPLQSRGAGIYDLRIQGEASTRQYPFIRRGSVHRDLLRDAVGGRGVQPGRRAGE